VSRSAPATALLPHELRADAALRLFCLPYAGRTTDLFNGWEASMPPGVEVAGIAMPGRGLRWRHPPYRRLPDLVTDLATELAPWLDRPYALFGHSMGALVSFELARELRRRQARPPELLMLSATRPPPLAVRYAKVHDLPDAEFVEVLSALAGTPQEILEDPSFARIFLPALRADFELCETYRYVEEDPIATPIVVFGGIEDPYVSPAVIGEWGAETTGGFREHFLPGGHFFVNSATDELLPAIASELRRVMAPRAVDRG
jgi:medium-chain acyl-[acyl-carrier-protein] hydrolase